MSEANLATCDTADTFVVETLFKDETLDALVVVTVSR
jgi:hypothetical protein